MANLLEASRASHTRFLLSTSVFNLTKHQRCMQWFSREIYTQREVDKEVCLSAWNNVKENIEQGTAMPSISKRALEKKDEFGLDDLELAYGVASPFGAGVGTVRIFNFSRLNTC